MTIYQQYFGKFTINSSNDSFNVATQSMTLTSADYFITGYTGESSPQLCEHLQNRIRTHANQGNANVTFSVSTGRITIDLNMTCNISWVDTDLGKLFGFNDAALLDATTYTAENQSRYVWRPSRAIVEYPGDLNRWWTPRSTTQVSRSKDGSTFSVVGNKLYDGKYAYQCLPAADVITDASTVWESLEQFWEDVIHAGKPMRVYPDRTLNAPTSYVNALFGAGEDGVGSFRDFEERHISTFQGLWDVSLDLWKHVG